MMAIYQKTGTGTAQLVPGWCNDDYCNTQSALYNLPLTRGQTYYIVVDGYGGAGGAYGINIVTSTPRKLPLDGATLKVERGKWAIHFLE